MGGILMCECCGGDCQLCDGGSLSQLMIKRIVDVGRIAERLREIQKHDIFNDLSKHNTYWHSKDEEAEDKLHDTRCVLSWVEEKLAEMLSIAENDD